jgi:lipid A 3-O-deacylase
MDDRYLRRALLLVATLLLAVGPVAAADRGTDASFLVGTGWFDANRRRNQAAELRVEYRSPSLTGGLRAVAATLATSDGSLFVGTGFAYEVRLGAWDVTPTFVPGVYRHGEGRDLGYPLEFRSQLELGRRLSGGGRVAVAMSHLSNAGLGSSNPGQESLTISYEWRRDRRAR